MADNLEFYKGEDEVYELVFNYASNLSNGEVIKDYTVYVNDIEITEDYDIRLSGYEEGDYSYDEVFTYEPEIYDNETILVMIDSGVVDSGYTVLVTATTNRRNEYDKTIDVFVDEYSYANVYDDFYYNFLVDSGNVYILPVISSGFAYRDFDSILIASTSRFLSLILPRLMRYLPESEIIILSEK